MSVIPFEVHMTQAERLAKEIDEHIPRFPSDGPKIWELLLLMKGSRDTSYVL